MTEQLKRCPFCGSEVKLRLEPIFGSDCPDEFYRISCPTCDMGCPDALYDSDNKDEIIKKWNTRTLEPGEVAVKREDLERIASSVRQFLDDPKARAAKKICRIAMEHIEALKDQTDD